MLKTKSLTPVIFVFAAAFILGGLAIMIFAVPGTDSTFYALCLGLIAVCAVLAGAGALFYLYLARDNDPNFFLFDTKSGRNDDPADLTFDRVNSRMSYFMSTLSTSQERLWSENVLAVNPNRFGVKEIYKPLAAYKMLYDLAQIDKPEGWQLFLCASPAAIDSLLDALRVGGEDDMPAKLRQAYNNASGRDDFEWVRDYITGNAKYIRGRMMSYVQKNMEWFY